MRHIVLSFLLMIISIGKVYGTSLWREGANLFIDHNARRVGDVITVIISESSVATHSTSTERGKEAMARGGPLAVAEEEVNILGWIPFFGASGRTEAKGEARTTRS